MIKRNRKGKTKGYVQANKVTADGIKFASGLERYTYRALKKEKLFEKYEGEKFTLIEGFTPGNEYWERQSNGKGEFTERSGKKVLGISYTPDFTGRDFIIECKGWGNETFSMRWKLFKKHLIEIGDDRMLFKPQCQKEVDRVIQIIKDKRNGLTKKISRTTKARGKGRS